MDKLNVKYINENNDLKLKKLSNQIEFLNS